VKRKNADEDSMMMMMMTTDEDEEEPFYRDEVITYVDQKALLRKQKYATEDDKRREQQQQQLLEQSPMPTTARKKFQKNERRGKQQQRQRQEQQKQQQQRMLANEGFQGFQDSGGFGLWGSGHESLEATATMSTATTTTTNNNNNNGMAVAMTTTPMTKNTNNSNNNNNNNNNNNSSGIGLDKFERRTSPRALKAASIVTRTAPNDNTASAVGVRRSPRKHKGSMDGPSTQMVSSPSSDTVNKTNKKKQTTTANAQSTAGTTKGPTNNQRKRGANDTNAPTAPLSKRGKITTTKTTAARGGRQSQQQANVRKSALVMTSTQQPSSNRGTLPTSMLRTQQNKPTKQTTGRTGRKDSVTINNNNNAPKALPLTTVGGSQGGTLLPRATSKMPTSTRDKVLGVVKPAPVIEKVRYDSKKNSSLDGTQSSLGNGTEEIEDDIEDDIIDSGDDEGGDEDETDMDVIALPKNAMTTTQKNNAGNNSVDDGAPPLSQQQTRKQGEAQVKEEKEKKKVTSFLPKLASPTNDLFLDGGGGKKSKRGTEFTGSGPKARLKRALQKLRNKKQRFEENVKKNRLEYDEGSSRENGVTFHVRSVTMERGIFRCFGYAKPMTKKKSEAEVIGDILEEEENEQNLGEDEDDFVKRKEKKELHDLLDDNGEYDVTVLFTKDLQKELNVSIGNRVEIFQPFHEVLARNAFGETARCIVRADFCRVLDAN
jgi:hypothetical protein